ncbi:MAG: NAD(+)/NADH kinase [Eubacteriaceae bacterium]|nr:NAD(+)/NADH kinase [Eubacteriaceae bacterium]
MPVKNQMNEVGIFLNLEKPESNGLGKNCIEYLLAKGYKIALLEGQIQYDHDSVRYYAKDVFFGKPDCILVLGGDGTLLSVARKCCIYRVPLFGINLGKLGFLTEGEAGHYEDTLKRFIQGDYYIEERMMLTCTVKKTNQISHEYVALNDVLVKSREYRMMDIQAYASGSTIDTIRADGLVISTPTGSTGYSLAAGGPVVAPQTDVIILNPICPHRLHDRSYILPGDEVITLKFGSREKEIRVILDGQTIISIKPEDEVRVEKSIYVTQLIRLNEMSYFDRLRIKLSNDIIT